MSYTLETIANPHKIPVHIGPLNDQKDDKTWDLTPKFFTTSGSQTWVLRHASKKLIPANMIRIVSLN